jgi:hypothetical protein
LIRSFGSLASPMVDTYLSYDSLSDGKQEGDFL